jgi:general secretion pathway protein I
MTRTVSTPQSGFTLLELLAALTLSVVGFTLVLNAMGQAVRHLAQDQHLTHMALTARTLFDERSRGPITPGLWQGMQDDVHWVLSSNLVSQGPSDQVFRLELVLDSRGQRQRFSSLRIQHPPPQSALR